MSRQLPHQRDSMGQFLNPDNGYRGALVKKGVTPRNHMKDNLKELRMAQIRLKQKKDEDNIPDKPLYKLAQFKDVPSRLYDTYEKENRSARLTERRGSFDSSKQFLSKGQDELRREELARERRMIRSEMDRKLAAEKAAALLQADAESAVDLETRKAPIPKEAGILREHSNADFITRNRIEAITMAPPKKFDEGEEFKHDEFGRVPQYLEQRKQQWAEQEEEMRRRMPDPDCPPGMTLMPEDERVNTLKVLEQSREEAMVQLRKLPFVIETPSMRKKQDFLENKLREIDHALSIFSKPKVFVAMER